MKIRKYGAVCIEKNVYAGVVGIKETARHLEVSDKYFRVYDVRSYPREVRREIFLKNLQSNADYIFSMYVTQTDRSESIKMAKQRVSVLESINEEREQKGKQRKIEYDREISELNEFILQITEEDDNSFLTRASLITKADSLNTLKESHVYFTNRFNDTDYSLGISTFNQLQSFRQIVDNREPFRMNESLRLQTEVLSQLLPLSSFSYIHEKGIYLGKDIYSDSLVILDFTKARNSNINILGTSGSGKSETAKILLRRFHLVGNRCIVLDPEGEYGEMVKTLGGNWIKFSPNQGIDLFSIKEPNTILSTLSYFVSSKSLLSLLDSTLHSLFEKGELSLDTLIQNVESVRLKMDLEVLRSGSFKGIFNGCQKIEIGDSSVCFDISNLNTDEIKIPVMHLILSLINSSLSLNSKQKTYIFIDEAHKLLRHSESREMYIDLVKTVRKRNGGVVSITQNPEDFTDENLSKTILTQAETTILLKQSYASLNHICDNRVFALNEVEEDVLPDMKVGEGIIMFEGNHIHIEFDNEI